jgi:hypothetical protein
MPHHTLPRARLGLSAAVALAALALAAMPLPLSTAAAQPRIDTTHVRLTRIPVAPFTVRDDARALLGHYVDVAQYFPDVAVRFECGELSLCTPDGDTLAIPWDHPLQRQAQSPRLPVYAYNSASWANEIVSLPFTTRPGDTLSLFRMPDLRFPLRDAAGDVMREVDTAALSIPDTVSFRIEVLDGDTRAPRLVLETVTLYPARCWSDCMHRWLARMIDGSLPTSPLLRWTPPPSLAGERLRIRVVPVFHPQLRGDFARRALYAFFFWSDRRSTFYADEQRRWAAAAAALIDSLRGARKREAGTALDDAIAAARWSVSPTQLTREHATITIRRGDIPAGAATTAGSGTLRLYDLRGVHLLSYPLAIPSDRGEWTVQLPCASLATGVYLLVLDAGGLPLVQPLTILR